MARTRIAGKWGEYHAVAVNSDSRPAFVAGNIEAPSFVYPCYVAT